MSEQFPTPPYPDRDDKRLHVIVETALQALDTGETDVRGAVTYAAVHGWMEGHLEGEDCVDECVADYRWHPDEDAPHGNPGGFN